MVVVIHTNNAIELFFATAKQGLRCCLDSSHLGCDWQDLSTRTALAAKLCHPDYVQIVCGSFQQLPATLPAAAEVAHSAKVEPSTTHMSETGLCGGYTCAGGRASSNGCWCMPAASILRSRCEPTRSLADHVRCKGSDAIGPIALCLEHTHPEASL